MNGDASVANTSQPGKSSPEGAAPYLIFPRCVDVVMDGLLLPRQTKKRSHGGGGRGD